MNVVNRARNLLFSSNTEWPVIAGENHSIGTIYARYLALLAAIPAIATFIGMAVVGVGFFGVSVRLPFFGSLVQALVSYGLSLVMVFVLGLVINALAPTFGGQKDALQAFKAAAYSMTASMVLGIGGVFPMLGALLGLIGAVWSIWLLYRGLPVLMKVAQDKAVGYTAAVVVCAIVLGLLVGALAALVAPGMPSMGSAGAGVTVDTPQGEVKLDEMARRIEEAGKRMEQASQSGDSAAIGAAAGEMVKAMGAGGRAPIAAQELKALLPESLAGLKRESYEAQSGAGMGFNTSSAEAGYGNGGEATLQVSIADVGGLGGLAAMAGWMSMTGERETETRIEKVYKAGGRTVREQSEKDGSSAEISIVLANGVVVEAHGNAMPLASVRQAVEALDLARLESLAPAK
ncbi:YIP1 family protein [Aquabacterium sp. A7-Y]|uniref:Yip1 family protein n=1 Tax=Aquabacterium sp. A7-Y TaxID=1349605 RepID=UPI00223DB04A|nr:Yip1 family protein [Aquabacterium sp. A7-Y]MCW7537283.1 YIP1 family protein [Aquabacterium sp. A7-Y]